MKILGLKPGHDGAIALVDDGKLVFSLEGEKDSFRRNGGISATLILQAAAAAGDLPDVLALGGWYKNRLSSMATIGAGYDGLNAVRLGSTLFFGKEVKIFSSSHERSHIYMTAAMAPEAPVREALILSWEGVTGCFYHWKDFGRLIDRYPVLSQPGARYSALFALADPAFPDIGADTRLGDAGKMMALCAFGRIGDLADVDLVAVQALLSMQSFYPFAKHELRDSSLYNCGFDSQPFRDTARYLSDKIFERFYDAAASLGLKSLPLLISGGCGLNCDWNTRWAHCGLFDSVFVPPCPNDSGSAIGTAVDAMVYLGDPCRLDWSVYVGAEFVMDRYPAEAEWASSELNYDSVALTLASGTVVPWVNGRYEIGPRALGHRSLLAEPFSNESKARLNALKSREAYRPIAPCCIAERRHLWFDECIDDPYMLYFARVRGDALPAITHIDGTARVQCVRNESGSSLYPLLQSFEQLTGFPVLCNTSLNYRGAGFINSMSDLIDYCTTNGLECFVVNNVFYKRV